MFEIIQQLYTTVAFKIQR